MIMQFKLKTHTTLLIGFHSIVNFFVERQLVNFLVD